MQHLLLLVCNLEYGQLHSEQNKNMHIKIAGPGVQRKKKKTNVRGAELQRSRIYGLFGFGQIKKSDLGASARKVTQHRPPKLPCWPTRPCARPHHASPAAVKPRRRICQACSRANDSARHQSRREWPMVIGWLIHQRFELLEESRIFSVDAVVFSD